MFKTKLHYLRNISFITILSLFGSCLSHSEKINKVINNVSELNDMFMQHRHLVYQMDLAQDINGLHSIYGEAVSLRKDIFRRIIMLMRENKINTIQIEYYSTSLVECRVEEQDIYVDSFIRISTPAIYIKRPLLLATRKEVCR